MNLKEYFGELPHGSKIELASKLGITKTWLSLIISGKKLPSGSLCNMIQKMTDGKVSRADLRPDLFGDV
jgi:hypothetical protein